VVAQNNKATPNPRGAARIRKKDGNNKHKVHNIILSTKLQKKKAQKLSNNSFFPVSECEYKKK
jgi:hypothetical protein